MASTGRPGVPRRVFIQRWLELRSWVQTKPQDVLSGVVVGIPQEVGEEFVDADKKAGKFQTRKHVPAALAAIAGLALDFEYVSSR